MGGYRSGRNRSRLLVEECLSIDVRRWSRERFLVAGNYFGWQWSHDGQPTGNIGVRIGDGAAWIYLGYSCDGGKHQEHPVALARQSCHLGGRRVWFQCPNCVRNVAKLYLRSGRFRCRHCHRLGYLIENQDYGQRMWMKIEKLERLMEQPRLRHYTRERLIERCVESEVRRDEWFDARLPQRFVNAIAIMAP
jgi:hypothetical protein